MFKMDGGEGFVVFNGPDEQLVSGLAMGADGIGGTYAVMPELYLKDLDLVKSGLHPCSLRDPVRRTRLSQDVRLQGQPLRGDEGDFEDPSRGPGSGAA